MKKKMIILVWGSIIILNSMAYAQSVETAIDELEARGLLTRITEKYRSDPGQYAFLKDLIIAAYDLTRKGTVSSNIISRIEKIESRIDKLQKSSGGEIGTEEIQDIVREKVTELMRLSEDKIEEFESTLNEDSLKIAQLEKRINVLEKEEKKDVSKSSRRGIFIAIILASVVALLSTR